MLPIGVRPNPLATLQAALEQHNSGRLDNAEKLYRAVLQSDANNADALNLLGVLDYQRGRNEEALAWLSRAVKVAPRAASFRNNLGLVLVALGRHGEAATQFEQAGKLDPKLHDAFYNLGVARQATGQTEEAIAAYRKALALAEDLATLNNLGAAYRASGRPAEAIRSFERALQLQPDHADALFNLAGCFLDHGSPQSAIAPLLQRSRLPEPPPNLPAQLGLALQLSGQAAAAETWYRQALLREPTALVCSNLASILEGRMEFAEAEQLVRRALTLQPDFAAAYNNLGNLLLATGRAEEAVLAYDQAIHRNEGDASFRYNRSHARLVLGDFAGGWEDYEYRWQWQGFPKRRPVFPQPEWTGDDLKGRTLLVYNEQGLGDTIQFARYLRLLADRGARVLFAEPAELRSLLGDLGGACRVLEPDQPLPPFDVHAALMSLPRLCGTRVDSIPAGVPYVSQPPAERFPLPPPKPGQLRVGLIWAGGKLHSKDKLRSIAFLEFLPLLQAVGCDFFSLQVGPNAADLAVLPAGATVTDLGSRVGDFADTAAVLGQLDLLISVDTAVLHLAGSLGRPAWALLPFAPDWRWLLQREDTPWYPTVRLFRQPALGDWQSVICRVQVELDRVQSAG